MSGEISIVTGGGVRTFSQVASLGVTALATVAVAVTVVLFFATALIPIAVLWPLVLACGCAALIGLFAFAIFRYTGWDENAGRDEKKDSGTAWESFNAMPLEKRMELWEKIRSVAQKYRGISPKEFWKEFPKSIPDVATIANGLFSICSHSLFGRKLEHELYAGIDAILNLLPYDLLMNTSPKDCPEFSVYDTVFECCDDENLRIELLKLLYQRFTPEQLRGTFSNSSNESHIALVKTIEKCAVTSERISLEWENLRRYAGLECRDDGPILKISF